MGLTWFDSIVVIAVVVSVSFCLCFTMVTARVFLHFSFAVASVAIDLRSGDIGLISRETSVSIIVFPCFPSYLDVRMVVFTHTSVIQSSW